MCGIAGYSLSPRSEVDRTRAAQALLAAIAERGADAVGYAHRSPGRPDDGAQGARRRQRRPRAASRSRPTRARCSCTCATTPRATRSISANNHPVRHGAVVGIHNGHIDNDDALMARHGFERAEPEMTVDSEVDLRRRRGDRHREAAPFEEFRGSMAAAWLDEREPELLYLARGVGRPLWVGTTRRELFFASTRAALEIAEQYVGVRLRKRAGRRGDARRRQGRPRRPRRALHARSDLRARHPAHRARARRGRVLPCRGSPRSPPR